MLYSPAHEFEPGSLGNGEAAGTSGRDRGRVLARYDALLADAATMLGAPCPPQPFTRSDRAWLEEALADLGLAIRAPSESG